MRRPLLVAAVLTLCLSLGSGSWPVSAGQLQGVRPPQTLAQRSSRSRVWESIRRMAALLKNGSGVDPFGHTGAATSTPSTPTTDNGSGVDPFGGK